MFLKRIRWLGLYILHAWYSLINPRIYSIPDTGLAHNEAETKWPTFCWGHFQMNFLERFLIWVPFCSLLRSVLLTIRQYWFRWRLGAKQQENIWIPGGLFNSSLARDICVNELDQHWFRQWLVAYSAPSHHLKQYWHIILRNGLQLNSKRYTKIFINENTFQNVVCKAAATLPRGKS